MIDHLDHAALTSCDRAAGVDVYSRVLDMQLEIFCARRTFYMRDPELNLIRLSAPL